MTGRKAETDEHGVILRLGKDPVLTFGRKAAEPDSLVFPNVIDAGAGQITETEICIHCLRQGAPGVFSFVFQHSDGGDAWEDIWALAISSASLNKAVRVGQCRNMTVCTV